MLSRKYRRSKGKRKEPLTTELKVQIALGLIPLIIEMLRLILRN